ncbi:MAG: hypothetical protein HKP61_09240 [Dactylosporangium sp.]|nr:hypothetical protein [Dactylosporangium sp.]NNJ61116.1 hypothetical protein [Dactylosporangium sp.]
MNLRDEVETVLRAWNAHETARGNAAIIDYDCHPIDEPVSAAPNRLWVLARLTDLYQRAQDSGQRHVLDRVRADLAYLRAVLGEHPPLEQYIRDTQGCDPTGWTDEQLSHRRAVASKALDTIGVPWGPNLDTDLKKIEGALSVEDAGDAIQAAAKELEPRVRELAATTAPYTLTVESVDVDAYWAYWLDGSGPDARLRLNLRQARFTQARARQFALHEVLGHALQCASYAHHAATEDVPWVRLMSVHTPYQVLLEGLAQALPLFVTPEDPVLVARVRLAHYAQLVLARLHLAINTGVPIEQCAAETRTLMPHWDDDEIGDALADRGADPLLRSYLWSYPAGLDWFTSLADNAIPQAIGGLIRAAYQDPLIPDSLAAL